MTSRRPRTRKPDPFKVLRYSEKALECDCHLAVLKKNTIAFSNLELHDDSICHVGRAENFLSPANLSVSQSPILRLLRFRISMKDTANRRKVCPPALVQTPAPFPRNGFQTQLRHGLHCDRRSSKKMEASRGPRNDRIRGLNSSSLPEKNCFSVLAKLREHTVMYLSIHARTKRLRASRRGSFQSAASRVFHSPSSFGKSEEALAVLDCEGKRVLMRLRSEFLYSSIWSSSAASPPFESVSLLSCLSGT